jgi:hypothetical protein
VDLLQRLARRKLGIDTARHATMVDFVFVGSIILVIFEFKIQKSEITTSTQYRPLAPWKPGTVRSNKMEDMSMYKTIHDKHSAARQHEPIEVDQVKISLFIASHRGKKGAFVGCMDVDIPA